MFAPAAERPWPDAWPLVAQTDDGNPWVTGGCWLYCRRVGVRVLWVGSVSAPGATGDVFACGQCIAELAYMVRLQGHKRDGITDQAAQPTPLTVPAHTPSADGSGGRHRLPRRKRGRFPAVPWAREAR
jgi:hypothetical protein